MAIGKPRVIVDIEVYRNFFVAVCRGVKTNRTEAYHLQDRKQIIRLLQSTEIVGFNVLNYDLPILRGIAGGQLDTHEKIKAYSDRIIERDLRSWQHDFPYAETDCIDLIEVAPGVRISLKLYGGRMHAPKMQDLPVEPNATLTDEQKELVERYCHNDVDVTYRLYSLLVKQLELRESIGHGCVSKSDAQIAEFVLKQELGYVTKPNIDYGMTWQYQCLPWLKGDLRALVENVDFQLSDKGAVVLPKALNGKKIVIGDTTYKLGIGGLHSQESSVAHIPGKGEVLRDLDVTSYYPSIILVQELYPEHLGVKFLDVYRSIVDRRVEAKRNGDKVTDGSLKITINGAFGKLGSKYSFLFAPQLMTQVTMTGQLALLTLIQMVEDTGAKVVSANTDGIVVRHHESLRNDVDDVVRQWERDTGFNMEETEYLALYSRDVNNYMAIKPDGTKGKGIFAESGLMKNPNAQICYDAIKANALDHIPIEQYIRDCTDITAFLVVRTVKGGAIKDGEEVGKVIRWYYSTDTDTPITYKTNGNKVPKSEGGKPLMDLPDELPGDIDYQWYIDNTREIMELCAYKEYEW